MPATPTGSRATRRRATTWRWTCTGCTRPTSTHFRTCSCGARCSAAGRPARCAATGPGRTRCFRWPTASSGGASCSTFPGPSGASSSTGRGRHRRRPRSWPRRRNTSGWATGDVLIVGLGSRGPAGGQEVVRRILRTSRRVPSLAPGARGRRSRQRRHIRPDAVRRHAAMALSGASDRDHRHGPAPDRQRRLARLGERCAALDRWEFLFTMGPLRIIRGTGCPVNPVAVL